MKAFDDLCTLAEKLALHPGRPPRGTEEFNKLARALDVKAKQLYRSGDERVGAATSWLIQVATGEPCVGWDEASIFYEYGISRRNFVPAGGGWFEHPSYLAVYDDDGLGVDEKQLAKAVKTIIALAKKLVDAKKKVR
jgi:hypothetical protein